MKKIAFLLAICILVNNKASFAQHPGDLDSSFGGNGKVTTIFSNAYARAVAIQHDEKIVVAAAGYLFSGFVVMRYLQNGTLDKSFGKSGIVTTSFGTQYVAGKAVIIQDDGRIIVGGYTNFADFALARYKPNGELDSSFGVNGKTVIAASSILGGCESLQIEPDGKIVATGATFTNDDHYTFMVLRCKQNGLLDSSFGENGMVITDFGTYAWPYSVSVQPDGKIIEAGTIYQGEGTGADIALVRCHHDGRLDSTFGTNGKVVTDLPGDQQFISVVKLKNGKIVVASRSNSGSEAILQYKSNGELDDGFGTGGIVNTPFVPEFVLPENGKILAGGRGPNDFALSEYRHNGDVNTSFGVNGIVTTDFDGDDWAQDAAIQKDGKIVAVGYNYDYQTGETSVAVARYYGNNVLSVAANDNNFSNLQKQNINSATIHISPNPANDVLHITGLSSSTKTISIIDAKGKLLRQVITASDSYSFNTKQLSAGMYFVRVNEGDKTTTSKFIKQ